MAIVYNILVALLMALTFGFQEFIPAVEFAQQARVLLPPVFFFAASLSVNFPMMLVLAFMVGLGWDARYLPYDSLPDVPASRVTELGTINSLELKTTGSSDLKFGYSIVLFSIAGALMQGIRPLFKRGRWELPVFMVGVATFTWLLIEYLMMSFLRGSFIFPPSLWTKLVTNALLAMLVSPILLFLLHSLAKMCRYEVQNEGLPYRFHGR